MARVDLVQTSDRPVGVATDFKVLHTFIGQPRTSFRWEHGGVLHPVNDQPQPGQLFVLFEPKPLRGFCGGDCCVPREPFIRRIEGPGGLETHSPLPELGMELPRPSEQELARVLAASLPIKGARRVGVENPYTDDLSSVTYASVSFDFEPPLSPKQMAMGAPPPRRNSVIVQDAFLLDSDGTRVVVFGRHATKIGDIERPLNFGGREPMESRRFQVVAELGAGGAEVLSSWHE